MNDTLSERTLTLTRIMDAPREALFRCWTEPELMKQWFCPRPWTTPVIEVDLRAGGKNFIKMRGPDGEEHDNLGIYLEVVPNEKLVFTDAFVDTWTPSDKAFMVGEITFEDAGDGKTKYTAIARHWSVEATREHEAMGFHEGWGKAADQLEETAKSLSGRNP